MELKDYYKILETDPSASPLEIKKAFRRLAHKYHPDKNGSQARSDARFQDIHEAYQVLIDPASREEYNYKRWHIRSLGKAYKTTILSAQDILREVERLRNYIAAMNIFHVDNRALSGHIRQLFNETNLRIIDESADNLLRSQIIHQLLPAASPLNPPYLEPVVDLMRRIAAEDPIAAKQIQAFHKERRCTYLWERYKTAAAAVLTMLICVLIYLLSR